MKKLLLGAVALTMLATACKKDDENGTPSNTITVDGNNYALIATNGFNVSGSTVMASGTSGTNAGTITLDFPGSAAPTAGTYKIVSNDSTVGANQVSFAAATTNGGTANLYESTGAGNVSATVTVNGGKIAISMPDAPAKQSIGGTNTVNVKVNVTQP
jgi:hypothetical protein